MFLHSSPQDGIKLQCAYWELVFRKFLELVLRKFLTKQSDVYLLPWVNADGILLGAALNDGVE